MHEKGIGNSNYTEVRFIIKWKCLTTSLYGEIVSYSAKLEFRIIDTAIFYSTLSTGKHYIHSVLFKQ